MNSPIALLEANVGNITSILRHIVMGDQNLEQVLISYGMGDAVPIKPDPVDDSGFEEIHRMEKEAFDRLK